MERDVIICFEVHVELNTETKLFCDCPTKPGAPPNSQVCPVCTGQPGALPVLNRKAVEYSIRTGLALNCAINERSQFARKNYFYPDLPKGYQISQYERPFCEDGYLEIPGHDGLPYQVGIKRIHLEEDAGKLVHPADSSGSSKYSLVDYNRSGVPLLEIVNDHTRNPLRSVGEARAYLEKIRQILKYIGVSDCIMEQGQLRCDVNISLRPKGSQDFGPRAEIKNMSSFKFIMDALEYEMKRQPEIIDSGGELFQETRLFDEEKKVTLPMRLKEDAPDYRYFADPDLLGIEIDQEFVREIEKVMPELPDHKIERFMADFDIEKKDALILTKDREVSEYFEACAPYSQNRKKLCQWIAGDLFKLLNEESLPIDEFPVGPEDFSGLVDFIVQGDITEKIGRTVLREMLKTGKTPAAVIEEKGLKPIQDIELLKSLVNRVIAENSKTVASIKEGKKGAVNFLIGQVMKLTEGKAPAKKVIELMNKKLNS